MSDKDDKDLKDGDSATAAGEQATQTDGTDEAKNDAVPQSVSFDIVFDDEDSTEEADAQSEAADDFFSTPLMGDDTVVGEETSASAAAANARRVNDTIALGGEALKNKATVDPNESRPDGLDGHAGDRVLLKSYPTFSLNHVTTTNRKSGRHVLDNTSMAFYAGELYAVKVPGDKDDAEVRTTLMAALTGFLPLTSGAVMTKSSNITELEAGELRGHRLGLVPQRYAVRGDLDAESNVVYAMNASGRTFLKPKPVIARELLARTGFDEATAGRKVADLPLPQQRRVAIARALSCEAETLILDEPTKGLDETDSRALLELLVSIAHGRNPERAVIIVTSSDVVADRAGQVYEL